MAQKHVQSTASESGNHGACLMHDQGNPRRSAVGWPQDDRKERLGTTNRFCVTVAA
jgi:hypothetical protein